MVKVMNNDQLVYKVVIWAILGISLRKEKVALNIVPINIIVIVIWNHADIFMVKVIFS